MILFIFSYNRGPHLWNCVQSIETCTPEARIVVFDDNSEDPETNTTLERIAARHEVRRPAVGATSAEQHGGLYGNMQQALDLAEGDELIGFLQDDTQLVRSLSEEDHRFLSAFFEEHPRAGFLAPVFQRGITRQRTLDRFVYQPERVVYHCEHKSRKAVAGVYYSDISITRADRLKSVEWSFKSDEFANEQQARAHFDPMGYLFAPFVMWLPNPPAYRNKKKTPVYRLGERINRADLYPFAIMGETSIQSLLQRAPATLPVAEHFLDTVGKGPKQPWIFHPLKRPRWLRRLARLEQRLLRLKQRLATSDGGN